MKAELIVYKILSFLLLPVAAFFGIICILSLLTALANPSLLISVFLNACMVIYIIASFIFLTRGIDSNQPCKAVLRDWIRINGIITFVFYLLVTIFFIAIKTNPSLLNDAVKQMATQSTMPADVTNDELTSLVTSLITFFLILSFILLVHIAITFHLLQKYRYLFEGEKMDIEE